MPISVRSKIQDITHYLAVSKIKLLQLFSSSTHQENFWCHIIDMFEICFFKYFRIFLDKHNILESEKYLQRTRTVAIKIHIFTSKTPKHNLKTKVVIPLLPIFLVWLKLQLLGNPRLCRCNQNTKSTPVLKSGPL